jgi:hypothetical protein
MGVASVGIARRRPGGFLVGMICHLLLEILGSAVMLYVGFMYALAMAADSKAMRDPVVIVLGLLCPVLTCLPFVLISGRAFSYLRRIRKRLFSQSAKPLV